MIKEVVSRVEEGLEYNFGGFHDVCYEWEEETAKFFNVPVRKIIIRRAKKESIFTKIKPYLRSFLVKVFMIKDFRWVSGAKHNVIRHFTQDIQKPLSLCYIMFVIESKEYNNTNCLPIFIDVWFDHEIDTIIRTTKTLKLFYVTSRDVFNRIKAKAPESNVHYMPLSISDKYYSRDFAKYRDKNIDVIQIARKNPVLHEYMLRYVNEHSEIEYVYKNEDNIYISTKRGIIGKLPTRESYMNLVASAKVNLVGCSGIDNARNYTFGIQFPTPRFYESAIVGCALIGRYPENQEFTELKMNRYCPNITSYDQFVECLEKALAQTPEEVYAQNHEFIINSLTSSRAKQIQEDLEAITVKK